MYFQIFLTLLLNNLIVGACKDEVTETRQQTDGIVCTGMSDICSRNRPPTKYPEKRITDLVRRNGFRNNLRSSEYEKKTKIWNKEVPIDESSRMKRNVDGRICQWTWSYQCPLWAFRHQTKTLVPIAQVNGIYAQCFYFKKCDE
ncbi:Uncharacterised protein g10977 [Pycnogonum litorale]